MRVCVLLHQKTKTKIFAELKAVVAIQKQTVAKEENKK